MHPIRQAAKSVLSWIVPPRWLLTGGPSGIAPSVALTFDDGPHPVHTPRLLDVLQRAGLRATFFVIGELASRHPDLVRRIVDEGHELGNHTWSHSEPRSTTTRQFLTEIQQTDGYLAGLTGTIPRTVRPPKGELNWSKLSGLWARGKTVALWNVDPRDYKVTSADEIVAWASQYRPAAGDIVLFHDNHPWAAIALEVLVARCAFASLASVTLSELIPLGHRPDCARPTRTGLPSSH